ncbi:transmembrane sensor [Pedobacter africanus]|uniref:Ferric-dicitrate binding protein FerR (Iron transport regulator)/nitrogen fixation protein n=1 Tax=Pedobacter africanus TaxID=151894 RepID=A0ACC6L3J1_9SPHI|nr:FecR domain-containing protein [Pedobacter africanus]MDR6786064.1 ferric-dicitrate binding protein FerR (iron transport regulator)/nitrogen fixation protein [Pedobacter africanus]
MTKEEQFREILNRYTTGKATEQEIAFLESSYQSWDDKDRSAYTPEFLDQINALLWARLSARLQLTETKSVPIIHIQSNQSLGRRIAIAAAVATIIVGAALFYYIQKTDTNQPVQLAHQNDIAPGRNGATLTLGNGKKIYLSDVKNGTIADESGVSITKDSKGQIIYTINQAVSSGNAINTLETSKGEQSQVQLPDGSTVYLNAASSLSYPANFTKQHERKVKLSGEAFFQVAKDKAHPFIVQTRGQQVQVLGTHFNINAYTDETDIKTTLLEGSVRVTPLSPPDNRRGAGGGEVIAFKGGIVLKPGQQSALTQTKKINIRDVDAEAEVAWKNGEFVFERENIKSIMRKISRWYNVDIVYEGDVEKKALWGSISRYSTVKEVLEMLSGTGAVVFEIRNKTIIVKPATK